MRRLVDLKKALWPSVLKRANFPLWFSVGFVFMEVGYLFLCVICRDMLEVASREYRDITAVFAIWLAVCVWVGVLYWYCMVGTCECYCVCGDFQYMFTHF